MIRILFLGDVVRAEGCDYVRKRLPFLKRQEQADVVIANGENAAAGNGLTPQAAAHLFDSGVDVITSGNHVFKRREVYDMLDEHSAILRPANYPDTCPGRGVCEVDLGRCRLAVLNLMGTVFLEPLENPFFAADRLLKELNTPLIFLDFHAEATAEKRALGFYLSGRISALVGTHTHVPTADETILDGHTAYLTDAGMVGPEYSVLGVRPEEPIRMMTTHLPVHFQSAEGPCRLDGVCISVEEKTGAATEIHRVHLIG